MKITRSAALANMLRMKDNAPDAGGRRNWYAIENAGPTNAAAEIYIYDEIGMWGVSASDFVAALRGVASPRINLHLNSPGGDIFDGVAIYNALRNHPSRVVAYVDGLAASAASFIAMAGAEIIVEPSATMMIHNAQGIAIGEAKDMRELADLLDKLTETIAGIYAARSGQPVDEWLAAMGATTWYNATEAVAAGLADRVAGVRDLPAEAEGADQVEQVEQVEQVDTQPEGDPMAEARSWWATSIIGRGPREYGLPIDQPAALQWSDVVGEAFPDLVDGWGTIVHDLTQRNVSDSADTLCDLLLKGDA